MTKFLMIGMFIFGCAFATAQTEKEFKSTKTFNVDVENKIYVEVFRGNASYADMMMDVVHFNLCYRKAEEIKRKLSLRLDIQNFDFDCCIPNTDEF